jgi:hypothetical protein
MNPIDQMLAALEAASEQNENIWEMAIAVGLQARGDEESSRLALGEVACRIQKKYGRNTIGSWAKAINKRVATIQEYRTLVRFYGGTKSACAELLEKFPNLSYSHLREAMRLKEMDQAYAFLQECSGEGWTIEQASIEIADRMGKPRPPLKIVDAEVPIAHMRAAQVTFDLEPGMASELAKQYLHKNRVRLVVYEVQDQEA